MKKLICLFFSTILLLGMTLPASAEETEHLTEGEDPHTHSFDNLISNTATCVATGTAVYACQCGEQWTVPSAATGEHTYSSPVSVDDTNHKQVCSVCRKEVVSEHSWDKGQPATEADCLQEGETIFTCEDCGATKTQKIPATGHRYQTDETIHLCLNCLVQGTHVWSEPTVKKPTCKEAGSSESKCTVCGKTQMTVLDKLKTHTYDSACDPDCNVCGAKRDVDHTFSVTWSKDADGHWHECTKCGEKGSFAKHNPGPEATEEKEQVCRICSYVIAPKKKHTHSYEKEWTYDEVGHWHICNGCKDEKDYASHVFQDGCDSDCNVCGYVRVNSHSYDDQWQTSKFEHWKLCTVCGKKSTPEKHIPGPEATDQNPQTCKICNLELKPIQGHTHNFGTEWIQMADGHYQVCTCGEQSVPEAHSWDTGKENRKGSLTYTCTKCGLEKVVEKPSSGSPWVIIVLILVALVCVGGIAALVIILKRGSFDTEEVEETPEPGEPDAEEISMDESIPTAPEDRFPE